jgi:acyl-homoserine-lactone acylase
MKNKNWIPAVAGLTALLAACAGTAPPPEPAPPPPPTEKITLYRDTWGVPHIYAASEEGGFYALGYAQAQDRLPQLLGALMWVHGRLAEVMGDAMLPGDIDSRRWLTWEQGSAGFARLSPELQRNYRAFVAGAKKYMSENPTQVPAWAPELTPEALTAITRAMYWTGYNAVWGPAECSKEGVRRQLADAGGYPSAANASNEWAVLPSRTLDGRTILLADPHVDVNNPFYYEYRMHAGGFESAGFAAGALLWQSQNQHVAWAFTTGHPDMWDCYAVQTDPADPRSYLYDGQPQTMTVRKETFTSSSGKTEEHEFEYTSHNGMPALVVAREGNVAYAVSQSQMQDGGLMDEEIYRMNRASNVRELRDALKTLGMMAQNLLAVDDGGHAFYLHAGKTPKRPTGYDWTHPVPGNTSKTAWRGFVPLEEMVQVSDPRQGYITNNNVSPDMMFSMGNLDADKYPAYSFYDTPGRITTRGVRTLQILARAQNFDVEDAKKLVFDEKWETTAQLQEALLWATKHEVAYNSRLAPPVRKLVQRVLEFNGYAHAESVEALNVWFWREEVGRVLERPEFKAQRKFPWTPKKYTSAFSRALLDAATSAVDAQVKAVGSIDQPLGRVFRAAHGGKTWPLGGVSILPLATDDCLWTESPQCDRTMRAFSFGPPDANGERIAARGSQAIRLVVFGKKPETFTLYAFGQQSTPGLPHADDQAELFSKQELKPALLDVDELIQHVESKNVLEMPLP